MKYKAFINPLEPFSFLSTFSNHPILLKGEIWPTVEHYYQASKYKDEPLKWAIKGKSSPKEVRILSASQSQNVLSAWDTIRDQIMHSALKAKFLQHPRLKLQLLNIDVDVIIINIEENEYWGSGVDNNGMNTLGKLLMQVRGQLLEFSSDRNMIVPPWIAFDRTSQSDMFWRMGWGEDYIDLWYKYFTGLKDPQSYINQFPENDDWRGFYE